MIPCMSLIVKYRVLTNPQLLYNSYIPFSTQKAAIRRHFSLLYHKKSVSILFFFVIFRIANFMYFL